MLASTQLVRQIETLRLDYFSRPVVCRDCLFNENSVGSILALIFAGIYPRPPNSGGKPNSICQNDRQDHENCGKNVVGALEGVGRILTGKNAGTLSAIFSRLAKKVGMHKAPEKQSTSSTPIGATKRALLRARQMLSLRTSNSWCYCILRQKETLSAKVEHC